MLHYIDHFNNVVVMHTRSPCLLLAEQRAYIAIPFFRSLECISNLN